MSSIAGNRSGSRKYKPQQPQQQQLKNGFVNLKINIRLLPPNLTEELFYQQLSKFTKALNDGSITDKYYVKGFYPEKPYEKPIYSRAYLLFKNQNVMTQFVNELTNRPFIEPESNDSMIPMIGNALYHKMPGQLASSVKNSHESLNEDDIYKEFLSFLDGKSDSFNIIKVTRKIRKKKRDKKRKEKKAAENEKVEKSVGKKSASKEEGDVQKKDKVKAKRRRKPKKDKKKEKDNNTEKKDTRDDGTKEQKLVKEKQGDGKPMKDKKPKKSNKKPSNKPSTTTTPVPECKDGLKNDNVITKDQEKPSQKKSKPRKKKNKNKDTSKGQNTNSESKPSKESTPTPKQGDKPKKKFFKNKKPVNNSKQE